MTVDLTIRSDLELKGMLWDLQHHRCSRRMLESLECGGCRDAERISAILHRRRVLEQKRQAEEAIRCA